MYDTIVFIKSRMSHSLLCVKCTDMITHGLFFFFSSMNVLNKYHISIIFKYSECVVAVVFEKKKNTYLLDAMKEMYIKYAQNPNVFTYPK